MGHDLGTCPPPPAPGPARRLSSPFGRGQAHRRAPPAPYPPRTKSGETQRREGHWGRGWAESRAAEGGWFRHPLPSPPCLPPLLPSETSLRGRNPSGNQPLTTTRGPCQLSLPLATPPPPRGLPLTALSKETKDGGKALKGTRTHTQVQGPQGRGRALGPEYPCVAGPGRGGGWGLQHRPAWAEGGPPLVRQHPGSASPADRELVHANEAHWKSLQWGQALRQEPHGACRTPASRPACPRVRRAGSGGRE